MLDKFDFDQILIEITPHDVLIRKSSEYIGSDGHLTRKQEAVILTPVTDEEFEVRQVTSVMKPNLDGRMVEVMRDNFVPGERILDDEVKLFIKAALLELADEVCPEED